MYNAILSKTADNSDKLFRLGTMKKIYTANLIAQNNHNELFLVKRAFDNDEAGLWSLPGGTKEKNETINNTLIREIKEELGLNIKKYVYFKTFKTVNNNKTVIAQYFTGVIDQPVFLNKNELSEYQWFPLKNIPNNLAYNQNNVLNELYNSFKTKVDL